MVSKSSSVISGGAAASTAQDLAGSTEAADHKTIDQEPIAALSESESDASYYSGLEQEEEGELGSEDGEIDTSDDQEEDELGANDEEDESEVETGHDDDENDKPSAHRNEKGDFTKKSVVGTRDIAARAEKSYDASEDDSDSEDDAPGNTIGNVPMEWYRDFPHIGYSLDGKPIMKPARGDELDEFLAKMDDPKYWHTVKDMVNDKDVVLTDKEIDIIQRIQRGHYASADTDPFEPYQDYFTGQVEVHPIGDDNEPKRRFTPSKWEHKTVMKLVRAIRKGWILPRAPETKPRYYEMWNQSETSAAAQRRHLAAPRLRLPGHDLSYNPPPEFLPNEEEKEKYENTHERDRVRNYLTQKYDSLRLVPRWDEFVQERFQRCLDLYLAPRASKGRIRVNPESLIPKLPNPRDLRPFPTETTVVYKGHKGRVRAISVDPSGQWLVSGGDDKTVRVWEVLTGRCVRTLALDDVINCVEWCPNKEVSLIAIACGDDAILYNPMIGPSSSWDPIDTVLARAAANHVESAEANSLATWHRAKGEKLANGQRLVISHGSRVKQVTWHYKGDYLAVVCPDSRISVVMHQLSKQRTQAPFARPTGHVQCVQFHPNKPFFFVATQCYVRVYDLAKQQLAKKLMTGVKWISSMDIHPQGDNVLIGSYDKKLCWFDLDLSTKPYKTMRYHKEALRSVAYHKRYPLFASASDDGKVHVFHGRVFSDLLHNPLIVPVKVLQGHHLAGGHGVLDCKFHSLQPWLFSSGADGNICLYT